MLYFGGPIMALDTASQSGIALGRPGDAPVLKTVRFRDSEDTIEHTWGRVTKWAVRELKEAKPECIFVETHPPIIKSYDANLIQIGIWSIIVGIADARGIRCYRAPVNDIRAHFIGSRRYKRDIAKQRTMDVCLQLGFNPANFDESDAVAAWHYGCFRVAPEKMANMRTEPLFLGKK